MRYRLVKVARSALDGRFVTKRHARRYRATTVVETYKVRSGRRRRPNRR